MTMTTITTNQDYHDDHNHDNDHDNNHDEDNHGDNHDDNNHADDDVSQVDASDNNTMATMMMLTENGSGDDDGCGNA